eukprot:scaffold87479_cov33-Tisochrysis_lutea.AAC.5
MALVRASAVRIKASGDQGHPCGTPLFIEKGKLSAHAKRQSRRVTDRPPEGNGSLRGRARGTRRLSPMSHVNYV